MSELNTQGVYGSLLGESTRFFLGKKMYGRSPYSTEAIPMAKIYSLIGSRRGTNYPEALMDAISAYTDTEKPGIFKKTWRKLVGDRRNFSNVANLALGATIVSGAIDINLESDEVRIIANAYDRSFEYLGNDDYGATIVSLACIAMAHKDFDKASGTYKKISENKVIKDQEIKTPEAITMLTSYAMLTSVDEVKKSIVEMKSKATIKWEDDQALALASIVGNMSGQYEFIGKELNDFGKSKIEKDRKFDEFTQMGKMMFIAAKHLGNFSEEQLFTMYDKFYAINGVDDWGALSMLLDWAVLKSDIRLMSLGDSHNYEVNIQRSLIYYGKFKMNGIEVMNTNFGQFSLAEVPPNGTLMDDTETRTKYTRLVIFL